MKISTLASIDTFRQLIEYVYSLHKSKRHQMPKLGEVKDSSYRDILSVVKFTLGGFVKVIIVIR